jgi:hypothetical protein
LFERNFIQISSKKTEKTRPKARGEGKRDEEKGTGKGGPNNLKKKTPLPSSPL